MRKPVFVYCENKVDCTARIMSDSVGNPEDRVSRDATIHINVLKDELH